VIDIGRILILLDAARALLTSAPRGGHHERLMQRFFGDWFFSYGRSLG
jgi:hypothetical protein